MTGETAAATSIAPPEPDLTQEEIVQRARDLVPVLRERQERCEELRRLPDETSRDFIDAGFYRILQPRRFGGYEFDLATFARVTIELSRGCPSSGWAYALVAGHAHMFSALWSEKCQVEVYGETGDFRMPGNVRFGTATKVDGGYRMSGAWDYVSGCDSATHFVLAAEVPSDSEGVEPERFTCVVDADQCEIVDNWHVHGLRGTGSKRVTADDVLVPAHRTIGGLFHSDLRAAPGRTVHENPFYRVGGVFSLLFVEITSVAVGTARGAFDVYDETLSTRRTTLPPLMPMSDHPDYHRFYGEALQLIEVAETALLGTTRDWVEWAREEVEGGAPFTFDRELRLSLRQQLCSKLAGDAVELMARTGATSAMTPGAPMERYRRDMTMLLTHNTTQAEQAAAGFGRFRFGKPLQSSGPLTAPPTATGVTGRSM
jgi:3-hydroxy-9,10-secoandrosta-1,3,5(10)-triene-9,17-dione monooxygenase